MSIAVNVRLRHVNGYMLTHILIKEHGDNPAGARIEVQKNSAVRKQQGHISNLIIKNRLQKMHTRDLASASVTGVH